MKKHICYVVERTKKLRSKRMDKYIPGDLCIVKGKVESVCEVDRDNDFSITTDQHPFIRLSEVKPILLTPEILEKNGWKKDSKWHYLKTRRAYLYTIQDAGQPDEFLICAGTDKHNLTSVSFVHQLQHLLFGLGLNSEMEV